MSKNGRIIYVPHEMVVELDDLMEEKKINKKSVAIRKLTKYARVGREVERIKKLDFGWLPTKNFEVIPKKKKKRRGRKR
jgi:metal-responsive CopG/Arc/MetJ family transcriptional regulator